MGRKRKRRTHVQPSEEETATVKVPKSFVFKRGRVGKTVRDLLADVRKVMQPNTASHLKERKTNTLKDFIQVAAPLGVTHFLIFSATDNATYLRLARVPRGPTLKFRIIKYSLAKDIRRMQRRPISPGQEFNTAPLVVLNNFNSQERHVSLMTVMFQNLFPAINVSTIKLAECRRVVLFDYDSKTNTVEVRHYAITASPVGVSRTVKRIVQTRLPDVGHLKDIADYVEGRGINLSDSEFEDGPDAQVEMPHDYNRKKTPAALKTQAQSAIRLQELGPRMKLQLIKVFCLQNRNSS